MARLALSILLLVSVANVVLSHVRDDEDHLDDLKGIVPEDEVVKVPLEFTGNEVRYALNRNETMS